MSNIMLAGNARPRNIHVGAFRLVLVRETPWEHWWEGWG
jgi:hypothetical protein